MASQKTSSKIFFRVLLCTFTLVLFDPSIGSAQQKQSKKSKQTKQKSDKVDISDLENKYWAPKDTDFSVVQNRTYSKEGRFAIAAQGGLVMNDEWSEGFSLGLSANYFFTERYGVELSYFTADLSNRDSTATLIEEFGNGIAPDFGRLTGGYFIGASWVPFYAKMSVLGKKIIYFDMAFTPKVGMTQYDQLYQGGSNSASAFSYGIDVTQYFFFSNHFAVRMDLKNSWFKEEVVKFREGSTGFPTGEVFRSKTTNTSIFLLGIMLYF